jgi:hypothetical protein
LTRSFKAGHALETKATLIVQTEPLERPKNGKHLWALQESALAYIQEGVLMPTIHSLSRRAVLRAGALSLLPLSIRSAASAMEELPLATANGGTDPFPIPWLDKNGSHNQPAGPNLEPSHIYHFKGRVARCSTFAGMGTDNLGNRLAFGSPTTDFGVMRGEYWAARRAQQGTLTHI